MHVNYKSFEFLFYLISSSPTEHQQLATTDASWTLILTFDFTIYCIMLHELHVVFVGLS